MVRSENTFSREQLKQFLLVDWETQMTILRHLFYLCFQMEPNTPPVRAYQLFEITYLTILGQTLDVCGGQSLHNNYRQGLMDLADWHKQHKDR